jgi:putative methyltransferase (TIGR04325 family)
MLSPRRIISKSLEREPVKQALSRLGGTEFGRGLLQRLSEPRGVYGSFEEAWSKAAERSHAGHDHPTAVGTHLELARRLRPSDYPALYWISQIPDRELRLFDFGGNAGNLFYSYVPYLECRFRALHWTVYDLPAVRAAGERIALERGATGLSFAESPSNAGTRDLLLVSGALHYWERPLEAFLSQFEPLPPRVLLNRTPVRRHGETFITVQKTAEYAVPCIVRNERELLEAFTAAGYQLVDRWDAPELSLRLPLLPQFNVPEYSGYYFEAEACRVSRASFSSGFGTNGGNG